MPRAGSLWSSSRGHEDVVRCANFSPDGRRIVTGGDKRQDRARLGDRQRPAAKIAKFEATWEDNHWQRGVQPRRQARRHGLG